MTEAEWLAYTDPRPMFDLLRGRRSDRMWRLFACACCRRLFWHILIDERARNAIAVSELYADELITEPELDETVQSVLDARKSAVEAIATAEAKAKTPYVPGGDPTQEEQALDAMDWVLWAIGIPEAEFWIAEKPDQRQSQCDLLRELFGKPFELFGKPFRRVSINPDWITPNTIAIAQTIYDEGTFERLPDLANTLVESGCDNEDVLNHCRSDGPHFRGCWVVDLVLEKE